MPTIPDPLETDYSKFSMNDLVVELHHVADKQEIHSAFQGNLPEYVTPPPEIRKLADELEVVRDAAAGHDIFKVAAMKTHAETCKLALAMNAYHVIMLSVVRKDQTLLGNSGYPFKQKGTGKVAINLMDEVPNVSASYGGKTGSININVKRAKNTANVELQVTDQDPNNEGSWNGRDIGVFNKSRIARRDLEPAKKIFIRGRYHEDGKVGRWSAIATIIVI